ncbi:Mov34/MPN/PAD-1 family protein [Apiospora arundinis]
MADDPKHPDNWDREKKIFMAIIEVNNPGFSLKGWAEVAAKLGLSEATVKQCFGECKKNWLSANEGVTMPAPVIKTRKRGNKGSVANEEEEVEDDGDDVPSAVPGRHSQATSSALPANSRARRARRTTPKAGNEEIGETSQPQSEAHPVEEEVEDDGHDVPSTELNQPTQATSPVPPVNNRARRTPRTATQADNEDAENEDAENEDPDNEDLKEAGQAQSEARSEPQPPLPATSTSAGDKRERSNYGNAAANSQTRSPATGTKKGKKSTPLFEKWTRERRAEVRREREELARQAKEDQ